MRRIATFKLWLLGGVAIGFVLGSWAGRGTFDKLVLMFQGYAPVEPVPPPGPSPESSPSTAPFDAPPPDLGDAPT